MPEKPKLQQRIQAEFISLTENHFGYQSNDLHVIWTPIIEKWLLENYEFPQNITAFVSQLDGKLWLEIPFEGKWD